MTTEKPTSEGVAEMLAKLALSGHRLGLQLYPDKDHATLIGAIKAQGAEVDPVLPYVYDAQAADANIVTAIEEMAHGRIDAIALADWVRTADAFIATVHAEDVKVLDALVAGGGVLRETADNEIAKMVVALLACVVAFGWAVWVNSNQQQRDESNSDFSG